MEKRFALRRKTEKGFEFATFLTWQGPVVPCVHDNYWSEDVQKATLLRPLHLNAERKGRTTQSWIEEYLPEVELVEVQVTLKETNPQFERGDLISWQNVNEHYREYGTVLQLVNDPDDEKAKVFFVDDYRSDGFMYEEDITLITKANNRLDDWQSIIRDFHEKEGVRHAEAKRNSDIWEQVNSSQSE